MNKLPSRIFLLLGLMVLASCSPKDTPTAREQTSTGTGGGDSTGGQPTSGGAANGGQPASGGAASGGQPASGGAASGGQPASGGAANGGQPASGGAASGGQPASGGEPGNPPPVREPQLPPTNQAFDYQIGGGYPLPDGVGIVSRDRTDAPAPGAYNLCYINGFQTQPDGDDVWDQNPDLILRTGDPVTGAPVIDSNWGEMLLDVSTSAKRGRLAEIVGAWIEQCATDGFDAIEVDNLDSYDRSSKRLTKANAVAFMALLSAKAHSVGLAIAQKNATDLVQDRAAMGTDLVVAEECDCWDECDVYTAEYQHVLVVEYATDECANNQPYTQKRFLATCAQYEGAIHRVFRDVNVSPRPASYPSSPGGYRYLDCE